MSLQTCPLSGLLSYLGTEHLWIPASGAYCAIRLVAVFASSLSGVYLILAMTFDRFYGIMKPARASSIEKVHLDDLDVYLATLETLVYSDRQH